MAAPGSEDIVLWVRANRMNEGDGGLRARGEVIAMARFRAMKTADQLRNQRNHFVAGCIYLPASWDLAIPDNRSRDTQLATNVAGSLSPADVRPPLQRQRRPMLTAQPHSQRAVRSVGDVTDQDHRLIFEAGRIVGDEASLMPLGAACGCEHQNGDREQLFQSQAPHPFRVFSPTPLFSDI
jgi:hypothetical protein